jgi:predicted Zn-dependent protease with MMP-like domain
LKRSSHKLINYRQEHDELFEKEVLEALELLPESFAKQLKNVEIVVEETQPDHIQSLLLGLYHGVPSPYKGIHYSFVLPDKISLYKRNIIHIANQRQIPLKQVIAEVLYHEIGHYFGLSESELDHFRSF